MSPPVQNGHIHVLPPADLTWHVNLIGPVGSGLTNLGIFGTAAVCSMAYAVKVTCLGRLFAFERKGTGNHTHYGCSAVLCEFQFFGLGLLMAGGLRI